MNVSITQFASLAKDANGNILPMGNELLGEEAITADGAFAALEVGTKFIRLASDTSIHVGMNGGASDTNSSFFPAGSVEYISVDGGEIFNVVSAA